MAASLALGGLSGCAIEPAETDRAVRRAARADRAGQAAVLRHGDRRWTASPAASWSRATWGGRPRSRATPTIPASLGATDAFAQAAILDVLRPGPLAGGDARTAASRPGSTSEEMLLGLRERKREAKGAGLRILTRDGRPRPPWPTSSAGCASSSPRRSGTPTSRSPATPSAPARRLAFGEELEPVYHLDKADVIVALDADFLAWGPGRLKDARAFAARREVEPEVREFITGRAEPEQARRRRR